MSVESWALIHDVVSDLENRQEDSLDTGSWLHVGDFDVPVDPPRSAALGAHAVAKSGQYHCHPRMKPPQSLAASSVPASFNRRALQVSDLVVQQSTLQQQVPGRSRFSLQDLQDRPMGPPPRKIPRSLQRQSQDVSVSTLTVPVPASIGVTSPPTWSNPQMHVASPPNVRYSSQKSKTLRLKQASHDPIIMPWWHELLEPFSDTSMVGQSLKNTEHKQIHSARILDGFALSTLYKYMGTVKNLLRTCFLNLSESEMADVLVTIRLAKSSDCTGATCTSTIKALRWFKRTAELTIWEFLYDSFTNSFLTVKIPRDRREAAPISLWIKTHLERKLLQTRCEPHLVMIIGSILTMVWGSLRFADVQWTAIKTLCYDGASLRGMLWRTKVSCKSQPFGIIRRGLLSHGEFSWMHRFLIETEYFVVHASSFGH